MDPGRELDVLIAKTLFSDSVPLYVCGATDKLPHYSTDIAAAWGVLEKFHYPKIEFEHFIAKWICSISEPCTLSMTSGKIDRIEHCATAETAPHAICLAALKVLNMEIPQIG